MIDPDQSPKTSIAAQKTMTQRYDAVPFSGHELAWDATAYAKTLYDTIIGSLSSGLE
jgi:hydroxyacyl-ACP dehydratase HTD2-like protein with hotdog domain